VAVLPSREDPGSMTAPAFARMKSCQDNRVGNYRRRCVRVRCGWCASGPVSVVVKGDRLISKKLRINHETWRLWVRKAEADGG
jgi:hypothetical protein